MRIITGAARGVKLKSPKGSDTRPTADRIKESLFNILGYSIIDTTILDLFSGTGNLALESLSRGATSAICVDYDIHSIKVIKANIELTKMQQRCSTMKADIHKAILRLANQGTTFDIIFADPPYGKELGNQTLELLSQYPILKENGLVIIEHGADDFLPEALGAFSRVRHKSYGATTHISFYQYTNYVIRKEATI